MVIKLMNIVVKPLIKLFSETFFSKNGIFAQENERLNISEDRTRLKNFENSKSRTSILNRTV